MFQVVKVVISKNRNLCRFGKILEDFCMILNSFLVGIFTILVESLIMQQMV
jgi:hypothetical protein